MMSVTGEELATLASAVSRDLSIMPQHATKAKLACSTEASSATNAASSAARAGVFVPIPNSDAVPTSGLKELGQVSEASSYGGLSRTRA
jgi:hypothetical protein